MKRNSIWLLLGAAVVLVLALGFVFWPRSEVPAVEKLAGEVATAITAQDKEQLVELLGYEPAAETLLKDAVGGAVTFEAGDVSYEGDHSYVVRLTPASGSDKLLIYLDYHNGQVTGVAVP